MLRLPLILPVDEDAARLICLVEGDPTVRSRPRDGGPVLDAVLDIDGRDAREPGATDNRLPAADEVCAGAEFSC